MPVRVRLKYSALAERLALSRCSQNAWAQRLGVSSGYLSLMVNGKRRYPGSLLQRRLLRELKLDFEELFELEEQAVLGSEADSAAGRQIDITFWRWKIRLGIFDRTPSPASPASGGSILLQDLYFSLRLFRRRKLFSAVAILTIALGIGMSSAMFSIVQTVLLDPLPYPESERLVRIFGALPEERDLNVSPLDFQDWERQLDSFESLGAYSSDSATLIGAQGAELYSALIVTPGFFSVLGVKPEAGRFFLSEEAVPRAPLRVVLGHSLWQNRFGSDPAIVGQSVSMGNEAGVVVGIAPADFVSPEIRGVQPELWVNLRIDPERNGRGGHWLRVIGRLKPEVDRRQAQAELDLLTAELESLYPATNEGWGSSVVDLKTSQVVDSEGILWSLMIAVGLVLLIAAINLAGLLLSFTLERIRELGVRLALGATFARLTRQLMTESLALTTCAFFLGLLLCRLVVSGVKAFGPNTLPRLSAVEVDLRVVGFALLACLLTSLIALAPALLRLRRVNLTALPRWGSAGLGRFADLVVVGEVALTITVLIGAGLLARSLYTLLNTDPGFAPTGLLTFEISLPRTQYARLSAVQGFFADLRSRLESRSDVFSIGTSNRMPLGESHSCDEFMIENHAPLSFSQGDCAESRISDAGYFKTLQIPLLEGRLPEPGDDPEGTPVAIVNQALATKYWPGRSPLGRRLRWGSAEESAGEPWRTIVGVVGDVRHFGVDKPAPPEIHLPPAQYSSREMSFAVRLDGPPERLLPDLRSYLRELDPTIPLRDVAGMEERLSGSLSQRHFNVVASWSFAVLAVILAMAGIYGVISCTTQQRIPEIGVRVALGARRREILLLMLAGGFRRSLIGLGIGMLLGWRMSGLIADQLVGISPLDPWAYLLAAGGLLILVGLAGFMPARHATRIPPADVLRW